MTAIDTVNTPVPWMQSHMFSYKCTDVRTDFRDTGLYPVNQNGSLSDTEHAIEYSVRRDSGVSKRNDS